MTSQSSTFRGYWAILEVKNKVDAVVSTLDLVKKPDATISLSPTDYDLLTRWPRAASTHGFSAVTDKTSLKTTVSYKGHALQRYAGVGRYEAPQGPEQAVIV